MTKMRNRWVGKHSCEAGAQGAERSKKKPSKLRGEGGGRGRTERGYHTFWLIRRSNGKPSKSLSQQAICSELYFGMVSLAADGDGIGGGPDGAQGRPMRFLQ